jgi:uncharacterized membrane protein YobD (UPF0266 family)
LENGKRKMGFQDYKVAVIECRNCTGIITIEPNRNSKMDSYISVNLIFKKIAKRI